MSSRAATLALPSRSSLNTSRRLHLAPSSQQVSEVLCCVVDSMCVCGGVMIAPCPQVGRAVFFGFLFILKMLFVLIVRSANKCKQTDTLLNMIIFYYVTRTEIVSRIFTLYFVSPNSTPYPSLIYFPLTTPTLLPLTPPLLTSNPAPLSFPQVRVRVP